MVAPPEPNIQVRSFDRLRPSRVPATSSPSWSVRRGGAGARARSVRDHHRRARQRRPAGPAHDDVAADRGARLLHRRGRAQDIEVPELPALWPALEDCARGFYRVTAGGEALPVLDAHVDATVENDLDIKLSVPRPARSPLVFDAVDLQRLAGRAMAGVVLTATGARTFLGQKVLRPDDAVFEVPITAEAEAPGTPPLPGFRAYLRLGVEHILTGDRSPAVPARAAGRLPALPDRRGASSPASPSRTRSRWRSRRWTS